MIHGNKHFFTFSGKCLQFFFAFGWKLVSIMLFELCRLMWQLLCQELTTLLVTAPNLSCCTTLLLSMAVAPTHNMAHRTSREHHSTSTLGLHQVKHTMAKSLKSKTEHIKPVVHVSSLVTWARSRLRRSNLLTCEQTANFILRHSRRLSSKLLILRMDRTQVLKIVLRVIQ